MPKHIRQRFEWDSPLAQEERFLHFLRAPDAVGHEKGGAQSEDRARRFEFDAPQRHARFARAIPIVEPIALRPRPRKQFGVLVVRRAQLLPILGHIVHTVLIVCFTRKRHADMFDPVGWGTLLAFCVAHHSTVWQIVELPSLLVFPQVHQPQNPLEVEKFHERASLLHTPRTALTYTVLRREVKVERDPHCTLPSITNRFLHKQRSGK